MEKLYVDKWFKMPPKDKSNKYIVVKTAPKGSGKRKTKNGEKSCKKIKKKTS